MGFSTAAKSRKRAADEAFVPSSELCFQSATARATPPAKKHIRHNEDKGPDKYCHFCQHAKQTMMACITPGCNHRYCVYCLELHLQEHSSTHNTKQWLCPTCRGTCCCCSEDGVCDRTHRHCKAFRYRARRAQNAASKRAIAAGDKKSHQNKKTAATRTAAAHRPVSVRHKAEAVEETPPNDAMLALLELAKERLYDEVSHSPDGAASEWESSSCSEESRVSREHTAREGSSSETSTCRIDDVSDTDTVWSKHATPRIMAGFNEVGNTSKQLGSFAPLAITSSAHDYHVPSAKLEAAEPRILQGSSAPIMLRPIASRRGLASNSVMLMHNLVCPEEEVTQSPLSSLVSIMLNSPRLSALQTV